jgi:hypothetical protein
MPIGYAVDRMAGDEFRGSGPVLERATAPALSGTPPEPDNSRPKARPKLIAPTGSALAARVPTTARGQVMTAAKAPEVLPGDRAPALVTPPVNVGDQAG